MRLPMLWGVDCSRFSFSLPQLATASPSPTPTQSLGAFLTPTDAWASSSQAAAGRTARKLIDGSGWGETARGSGVYVHTSDVGSDGTSMWNGDPNSWLVFDLGQDVPGERRLRLELQRGRRLEQPGRERTSPSRPRRTARSSSPSGRSR